jgi:hypothetical protein
MRAELAAHQQYAGAAQFAGSGAMGQSRWFRGIFMEWAAHQEVATVIERDEIACIFEGRRTCRTQGGVVHGH